LFFPGQNLSDDEHLQFALHFGDYYTHPIARAARQGPRVGHIVDDEDHPPFQDVYHTDVSWDSEPPTFGVLRMLDRPARGGDTIFANPDRTSVSFMRSYLDAMDLAPFMASPPSTPPQRVIGALAPKMLALAAQRTLGAHPYFVPPEHTARAREIMGKGPLLAPEQAVILETDPATARAIARGHMAMYLGLPNYANNLRSLGFGDDDLANGGSDRLVDAIVAWGDIDAIRARIRAHHDAGADHVCIQVLPPDPRALPMQAWRELAPALLGR